MVVEWSAYLHKDALVQNKNKNKVCPAFGAVVQRLRD